MTQDNSAKPKPQARSRRPYPPMSLPAWQARMAYLQAALAKVTNPALPEPPTSLLTAHPHGPFTAVWEAADPESGESAVFFTIQNAERGPRWTPPEVFLMLDLLLAYGGGLSVNDTGKGWAYLRPWGGVFRHTLGRLIYDAKLGDIVRQRKRVDHHAQLPANFFKASAGKPRADRPSGTPKRDRGDAIETALDNFHRTHRRSELPANAEEYRQVLRDAFRLVDAYHAEEATEGHGAA